MVEKSLYEKIVEKGSSEAAIILKKGKEKAEQIRKDIVASARKEADAVIDAARSKADKTLKTKKIEFEQQARHDVLSAKKESINHSLSMIIERLRQLCDDEFKTLVLRLIRLEPLAGDEVIFVSADEIQRYRRLFCGGKEEDGHYSLDILNAELGEKYNLRLRANPAKIKGGLLIVGRQYDVNLSYESLLDKIKEDYEPDIAKIIFRADD